MSDEPRYSSLQDYLQVLRAQLWVIVLLTLIGGGVAYFLSAQQESKYDATASISFEDETSTLNAIGDSNAPTSSAPGQTPQARAQTIKDTETVKAVQKQLEKKVPATDLQSAIVTSLDEATFLVDVTATWDDGEFAARLANLFTQTAADEINREARKGFEASLDDVRSRIKALGDDPADQVELSSLVSQQTRLQFLSDNAKPATISQVATTPGAPTSPKPLRNTFIGLLLGLIVGIMVAFLRNSLDQRLRGPADVRAVLPFPIVGHLGNDALGKVLHGDGGSSGERDGVEQIQILRQNLHFLDVDNPPKVVLVTSALPEEGKSTVAASLAHASAAFGAATLLLECDLRRPALGERLGIPRVPGLTDHISGQSPLDSIFRLIPPDAPPNGNGAAPSQIRGESLAVIPAGTMSPQPAEILESGLFEQFLDAVKQVYDVVIIDSSPLLPVADTLELLPAADCVLLCVRSSQTTRDQARAARAVLEHYPSRPTGLVITGLTKRDGPEYGYYGYEAFGGGHEFEAPNASAAPATAPTGSPPRASEQAGVAPAPHRN